MAIVKQPVVEPTFVLPSFNFAPFSGPIGTPVTLSGSALATPVTTVLFNGVAASRYPDPSNAGNLIAIVPQGATDGPITITHADGSSQTTLGSFDVTPGIANPMIRNFFPMSGGVGTQVQLDGSGFTLADTVLFGTKAASQFIVQGDVNIIAVVPVGAMDGPITVRRGAQRGSSVASFDVTGPLLSIGSFSPMMAVSGAQISIFGSGFLDVDTVLFGGLAAFFSIIGDGQLLATVPAGQNGQMVNITVKKGGMQAVSLGKFTYGTAGLSVSSISPAAGAVGTLVSIGGNDLGSVRSVRFAGTAASFTILSPNLIRATVPFGAMDGFVTVEVLGQVAQSDTIFDVTTTGFAVTGINPASGQAGSTVMISGTGLLGVDAVFFGNAAAAFRLVNDNAISVTVPANPAGSTVAVSVRKLGQVAVGSISFTYAGGAPLQITGFVPNPVPAGQVVRILGSGFNTVLQVRIGRLAQRFTLIHDNEIQIMAGASGLVNVISAGASAVSPEPLQVI
jgi:IPT/TIG domain